MKAIVTLAMYMTTIIAMPTVIKSYDKPKEPVVLEGYLSAYNYAPTVGTIAYRQGTGEIPHNLSGFAGVIAVKDCGLVGKEATLIVENKEYPVVIFDCASRGNDGTREWMDRDNILAEIGYFLREKYPHLAHSYARLEYYP